MRSRLSSAAVLATTAITLGVTGTAVAHVATARPTLRLTDSHGVERSLPAERPENTTSAPTTLAPRVSETTEPAEHETADPPEVGLDDAATTTTVAISSRPTTSTTEKADVEREGGNDDAAKTATTTTMQSTVTPTADAGDHAGDGSDGGSSSDGASDGGGSDGGGSSDGGS